MRLPIAPNVLLPATKNAGHHVVPPDRQEYVDAVIIPMRTPLPEGVTRAGGITFLPAPGWAATLVDQLASLVLRDCQDYAELLRLTRRLLETEARARAALTVIATTCTKRRAEDLPSEDHEQYWNLGVFEAAVLMKRLDALP